MDNLVEKLDTYIDESCCIASEHFAITDHNSADWAVHKILKYQNNILEAKKLAEQRIVAINAWLTKETTDNQKQIDFLQMLLRPFAEQQLNGLEKKSFSVPSGTIGFRSGGNAYMIDNEVVTKDNKKLTQWVKENAPEYVVTKEETKWGEFKKILTAHNGKAITADGETIPDMTTEKQPEILYVKG